MNHREDEMGKIDKLIKEAETSVLIADDTAVNDIAISNAQISIAYSLLAIAKLLAEKREK